MTTVIRPARFSEVPALFDMAQDTFAAAFPAATGREPVEGMLGGLVFSPEGYLRVVELDDQIAGFIAAFLTTLDPWSGARIAVERIIYVDPAHRGRVVFLMMRDFIGWARANNCTAVFASSQMAIAGGRFGKVLERLGFDHFETQFVMKLGA
jgi:GNAT superfamily N-acetyltransferase